MSAPSAPAAAADPHQSEESYSYRDHRFGAGNPFLMYDFDPIKAVRGISLPFKARAELDNEYGSKDNIMGPDEKDVLNSCNKQIRLTGDGQLIFQLYRNNDDDDHIAEGPIGKDYSKGLYLDDLVTSLQLFNRSLASNPRLSDHEKRTRQQIDILFTTIVVMMDSIAQKKHGFCFSEVEKKFCPAIGLHYTSASELGVEFFKEIYDMHIRPLQEGMAKIKEVWENDDLHLPGDKHNEFLAGTFVPGPKINADILYEDQGAVTMDLAHSQE